MGGKISFQFEGQLVPYSVHAEYPASNFACTHRPGLANRMRHQKASALLRPFPKSHLHFAKPGVSVRVCAVPHGSCAEANSKQKLSIGSGHRKPTIFLEEKHNANSGRTLGVTV